MAQAFREALVSAVIIAVLVLGLFSKASGEQQSLSREQERAVKPKDTFRDCEKCPEMIVVPAGSFIMGSPMNEVGRYDGEGPRRTVSIAKPFAVGKFHVTVDQFAAFVAKTSYDAARSA